MAAKRGYKLQEFVAHGSDVTCLNIGKKSCRIFVTGSEDRKVNLWEFGKPICLLSFTGHTSSVQSVTFDSAEELVLAGSSNGVLKLWDLEEAKLMRTIPGHRSNCTAVQFHPFGEFLASGSLDTDLRIWDIRKKGCTHTYKGHTRGIRTIRFSPDGRWVVTGGDDHIVKVWDLTAGKLLHDFKFHNGMVRCIDFHPQEFLLATGSTDRTVNFWDLETFELIGSAGPEGSGVRSMVFHPDGRNLFCGFDETLKVFSWEPIRCHDFVDMGWSTLGDLTICEGKLLGCSYNQSQVGVWVADISLISPYAAGVVPKKDGSMMLNSTYLEDHPVELKPDFTNFSVPMVAEPDCQRKTKGALRGSPVKPNSCNQIALIEDPVCSPVTLDSNLSGLKCNNAPISRENYLHESKSRLPLEVSTSNSATFRVSKTTEVVDRNSNMTSSGFPPSRMNSQLTRKKESMVDVDLRRNTRATDKHVLSPSFVSRDSGSGYHYVDSTTTRNPQIASKIEMHHMRQPSFSEGRSNVKKKLTASRPSSSSAESDSKSMDGRFASRLTPNAETVKTDESNVARIGYHYVDSTTTRDPQIASKIEMHHMRQPSFSEGRSNVKKKLTASRPSSSSAECDSKSMDGRFASRLTPNAETVKTDESNVARIGYQYVDSTTTRDPQIASKIEMHHMRQPSFSEGRSNIKKKLMTASRPSSSSAESDSKSMDGRFASRLTPNAETVKTDESNVARIGNDGNVFARNISLHQPMGLDKDEAARPTSCSSEASRVKYVRGVAVQLGRTRSLVERFEKKEASTASGATTVCPSYEESVTFESSPLSTNGEEHMTSKETKADEFGCEILLQGHDVFINHVKSRLTKLQVVHHFWAHNGIKGAIEAVVKLPDYSVQADVISILVEKTGLFTLDTFAFLLPLLLGLLNSKTERHTIVSLELLFELIKTFGPVIKSTVSNSSPLGVDLQAERRLELCKKSYSQLQKIRQILPVLIRKGGLLAKHAQKLNVALIEL